MNRKALLTGAFIMLLIAFINGDKSICSGGLVLMWIGLSIIK